MVAPQGLAAVRAYIMMADFQPGAAWRTAATSEGSGGRGGSLGEAVAALLQLLATCYMYIASMAPAMVST